MRWISIRGLKRRYEYTTWKLTEPCLESSARERNLAAELEAAGVCVAAPLESSHRLTRVCWSARAHVHLKLLERDRFARRLLLLRVRRVASVTSCQPLAGVTRNDSRSALHAGQLPDAHQRLHSGRASEEDSTWRFRCNGASVLW